LDIPSTNDQYVTLITREANRAGFWCLVQRSIFLHKPLPFCTTDFIAPSLTSVANNTPAPSEIWYRRPADIGAAAHDYNLICYSHKALVVYPRKPTSHYLSDGASSS
jgi:hypothetical protein